MPGLPSPPSEWDRMDLRDMGLKAPVARLVVGAFEVVAQQGS